MSSKYSNFFKQKCVLSVMKSQKSLEALAKEFNINTKTLYGWMSNFKKANNIKSRYLSDVRKEFSGVTITQKTIHELENENKTLKQERDVLMKTTAYLLNDLSK